ncbi:MAG: ParB/RepB/Spo0J family partition protein [Rikenellaceae bacterium]
MKQTKTKGLGRGLDAIFSSERIDATPQKSELSIIAIADIDANPEQPRRDFDHEALEALADSIRSLGIIQPITLRRNGARYTIISGERRYRASKMAGLERLPAYIREVEELELHSMALVENLQREDLNPIEIALGMNRLIEECELTQDNLAEKLGMKRSTISNYMRLLRLPDIVQYSLKSGVISMGHAKAIASLADEELQIELLNLCQKRELSVRAAEQMARKMQEASQHEIQESESAAPSQIERSAVATLSPLFKGKVTIKQGKKGSGKIVIEYSNESEIERFIKYFKA